MGHKALAKVQIGQETVQGSAVAADIIWRGPFAGLKDARTTTMVDEQLGVALKSSRKFAAGLMAEFGMPVTPLTPEQAPHVFEAGIKQVNTGVADGSTSSGYTYTYPFGILSLNTISTYTIETGDEDQAEEAEFCFVKSFTITAVKGEAVQISAEWAGRTVADTTFTPALSAPDVSQIHASAGSLFIDDNDGAFGDTAIAAGNILEMTLDVTTGLVPLFTIDSGELFFQSMHFNVDEFEASLEIKWVHAGPSVLEKAKWRANTERLVRLEFTGDDYLTPGTGTAFDGKTGLRIDFPGSYEEFSAIEFEEGKSVVTATLTGGYENTSGEGLELMVASEVVTLV